MFGPVTRDVIRRTLWENTCETGTHFTKSIWAFYPISKSHENTLSSFIKKIITSSHNLVHVRSYFCICHDSWAVVTCAKYDMIKSLESHSEQKNISTIFSLWAHKPLVWNGFPIILHVTRKLHGNIPNYLYLFDLNRNWPSCYTSVRRSRRLRIYWRSLFCPHQKSMWYLQRWHILSST